MQTDWHHQSRFWLGPRQVFDELRVANQVNEEQWAGAIPASEWVQMITRNPARALAVDHLIGSVEAGRKADLTIVRARAAEPGASLLGNHAPDVEMVWIGGERGASVGTAKVVQAVRPTSCEAVVVQGSAKRLCTPVLPLVNVLEKQFPWIVPVVR